MYCSSDVQWTSEQLASSGFLQLIDAILQIQIQVSYVGYDPKTERWETQQQQAAKTSDLTELRM